MASLYMGSFTLKSLKSCSRNPQLRLGRERSLTELMKGAADRMDDRSMEESWMP